MKNDKIIGVLDTTSSKEIALMEKKLEEKYLKLKEDNQVKKANTKIA